MIIYMFECCSPYNPVMNFTTEGCFCPEGMKLFSRESNICVESCGKYFTTILRVCLICMIQIESLVPFGLLL